MNEHEIARLAAALHQARPDWPTKQLVTLMSDSRMVDRPRRDVFVALAWVACEASSASPYRVLESGPWWRAAGVDGALAKRTPFDAGTHCGICSEVRERCRLLWANDHEFEAAAHARARKGTLDHDGRDVDGQGPHPPRPIWGAARNGGDMSERPTTEIDAHAEWHEDIGQRLMLAMTCNHGSDYFGSGAVCETCFANVQRVGLIIEKQAAHAWDQGRAAERRDWELTADLSSPDEDRQPLPNPYRVCVRPPGSGDTTEAS